MNYFHVISAIAKLIAKSYWKKTKETWDGNSWKR